MDRNIGSHRQPKQEQHGVSSPHGLFPQEDTRLEGPTADGMSGSLLCPEEPPLNYQPAVWPTCTEACSCTPIGGGQERRWKVLCSAETQEIMRNCLRAVLTRSKNLSCGGSSTSLSPITPGGITGHFTKSWVKPWSSLTYLA